jgi:hypothetical protein
MLSMTSPVRKRDASGQGRSFLEKSLATIVPMFRGGAQKKKWWDRLRWPVAGCRTSENRDEVVVSTWNDSSFQEKNHVIRLTT